jgi:hypothetical protein
MTHEPAVIAFNVLNHICNNKHIDKIVETTGSWKPAVPKQAFEAKKNGFEVTLASVVTKLEQSSLGTDYRLVMDLKTGNPPRPVNKALGIKAFSSLYGGDNGYSNLTDKCLLFGGGKCGQGNDVSSEDQQFFPDMNGYKIDSVEIYNRAKLLKKFDTATSNTMSDGEKSNTISEIKQCIVKELKEDYTNTELYDRVKQIRCVYKAIKDGDLKNVKGFDKDDFYSEISEHELQAVADVAEEQKNITNFDTLKAKGRDILSKGIGKGFANTSIVYRKIESATTDVLHERKMRTYLLEKKAEKNKNRYREI